VTTTRNQAALRNRLYEAYASQHAGCSSRTAAALSYRRDIRPALPSPSAGPVVDIGCGQGELVGLLLEDGYNAQGVDVSPEQVSLAHLAGLEQISEGDYREFLAVRTGQLASVTATDLLEHLVKQEVIETLDLVARALAEGGVFVARVPNSVSPFGGYIRHGDFTHESSFTPRSIRQLIAASGFSSVTIMPCPPVAHGLVSTVRAAVWKLISACYKIVLATETGTARGHIVTQNLIFVARKAGSTATSTGMNSRLQ